MTRTRAVIAIVVCALAAALPVVAQTPVSPDGWVVLPVDEYRALRDRALPPPTAPATLPVDATLTRIDYDLRIEGDAIAGRARMAIDVLGESWARVQIPAGLMVRGANLDGARATLIEGPPRQVLLSRPGRSVLTLEIVLPLVASAGAESVVLPASGAPITQAVLTLPRSGVDLTVAGGFVSERGEATGESRWTALGRPGQPLTLSWRRKVDDRRARQALRTRARITTYVGLGEDLSQVAASVRIEVLQGLMREATLAVPDGVVVNQVDGATVSDWDVQAGTLRVRLLDPVTTDVSFVVQGEVRAHRDGAVAIPIVRMPSAERETGGVAVDVAGAGEIAARQARGLDPADPSELGEIVAGRESPSMIAYRLKSAAGNEPRSLNVTLVRYTPQAVLIANVEEARYRALVTEDGHLLVEARYGIRNNQRSFLKVAMPAGATVWSAKVAGRPTRPGLAEQGALLLPLQKGRAGEEAPAFAVEIVYFQNVAPWERQGRARLELPAIDLPISRTGLSLHYSPRFRVQPQPGSFRLDEDPGPSAEGLRPVPPTARISVTGGERNEVADKLRVLVDRYNSEAGGRLVTGTLPVDVAFPSYGPSMFLASELTAEARAPFIELDFKRNR